MGTNKIFILLPDGIGLRNFAYSSFHEIGIEKKFDVVFWNNTPFKLSDIGFKEIKIHNSKSHVVTDIFKSARQQIEFNISKNKTNDLVYDSYRFPLPYNTLKKAIKTIAINSLVLVNSSHKGWMRIRNKINKKERETLFYQQCLKALQEEKPTLVFCTNQRHTATIAPILAAQDLGIPTATFIFSWDNLPKATMVLETDYYFVWSEHMKKELQFYYPYINGEQVFITGTPQFESHFNTVNLLSREQFFKQNGLDLNKKYICYSGDDSTTCPDDPQYLEDVAVAIKKLNKKGYSLGVIFRRCPVDFSTRFDKVLNEYKEYIVPLAPKWDREGEEWGAILPTPNDISLQMNTIAHTEMVINLGSSMVFDYAAHTKPCGYINYDVPHKVNKDWSVRNIYKFVHFRSMPNKEAVFWLNSADEIVAKIEEMLSDKSRKVVYNAQEWFEKINQHPAQDASKRIWEAIAEICKK
ncbi:hypothetical protein H4V97_001350 [Flavobacterium sp. CG_23.5]|uniref:UDP-glycosyltransferase n=1 Tax=Flavobacterium sp. CG_23.5 TaxID=2760708 RepID=UPI001AE25C62|nr:UDP-glycosyltransferase [Flavobacterium sp. CG_23.5]MBP2283032.1 hypothetical protein [Flavobacterium sp. CG_23.5]